MYDLVIENARVIDGAVAARSLCCRESPQNLCESGWRPRIPYEQIWRPIVYISQSNSLHPPWCAGTYMCLERVFTSRSRSKCQVVGY